MISKTIDHETSLMESSKQENRSYKLNIGSFTSLWNDHKSQIFLNKSSI